MYIPVFDCICDVCECVYSVCAGEPIHSAYTTGTRPIHAYVATYIPYIPIPPYASAYTRHTYDIHIVYRMHLHTSSIRTIYKTYTVCIHVLHPIRRTYVQYTYRIPYAYTRSIPYVAHTYSIQNVYRMHTCAPSHASHIRATYNTHIATRIRMLKLTRATMRKTKPYGWVHRARKA